MSDPGRTPESALPLKPADFHILMVLLRTERHGYGIMQAVAEDSNQRVRLEVGSMYRLIARLTDEGLIEESPRPPSRGTRRRYYRITEFGRRVAELEAGRLTDVVRLARDNELIRDIEAG
jgi:DNA-binding PadR family transcriptional regulator